MSEFAAVVLAGGAARRMGGVAKPRLQVAGVALLSRVLAAVAAAEPVVVVGPASLEELLPAGTLRTSEDPPGGGPVAAADAGLSLLTSTSAAPPLVALLAADLPFLTPDAVALLRGEVLSSGADGAVLVDETDRPQWLCGVWRRDRLAARTAAAAPGASLRDTVGALRVRTVRGPARAWFDCDTDEDLDTARKWAHADAG